MNVFFSWISGTCLLILSYYLFLTMPDFEFKTYESGLSSFFLSGIISRLLASLLAVCGVFLWLHSTSKIVSAISLIALGLVSYILFMGPESTQIAFPVASVFSSSTKVLVVFLLSILGIVLTYFFPHRKNRKKLPILISKYVLSIGLVTLIFVFNPLFPEEFQDNSTKSLTETQQTGISKITVAENKLMAFFTTSCPYCELAAKKLSLLRQNEAEFPEIKIFFAGTEEGVADFFKYTQTNFDYEIIEKEVFLEITEGSYPKMIAFSKENTPIYLSGRTFNYAVVDIILEHLK